MKRITQNKTIISKAPSNYETLPMVMYILLTKKINMYIKNDYFIHSARKITDKTNIINSFNNYCFDVDNVSEKFKVDCLVIIFFGSKPPPKIYVPIHLLS